MLQKSFAKYWKEKKANKSFSKCVPSFNKKDTFKNMLNELLKVEDLRKLDYENRIKTLRTIFGFPKDQFKNIEKELKQAIEIGYNVKIETTTKG